MTVKKICCLELGRSGVATAAVIAANCPEIKVTVVHSSAERTFLWTVKQIPSHFYGARCNECIRKCKNKNLFFTTNSSASINEADMILIVSDSKLKNCGDGKGKEVDLTPIQDAAHLIASVADSSKIVVEMSGIPLNTTQCIKRILTTNRRPGVEFQVLSSLSSCRDGTLFSDPLDPECVLIGVENEEESLTAAKHLSAVFERWVDSSSIVAAAGDSADFARLYSRAVLAQRAANLFALAPICEKIGADLSVIAPGFATDAFLMGFYPNRIPGHMADFYNVVSALVYFSDTRKCKYTYLYWSQVTRIIRYHSRRLTTRVRTVLNGNLKGRQIAIFGFACRPETNFAEGSVAVDLCRRLLDEGATVRVFDPKVSQIQAMEDVVEVGCLRAVTDLSKFVSTFSDPLEAVSGCEALIVCSDRPEFAGADFQAAYSFMKKPPCLLDTGNFLRSHTSLINMGFRVLVVGKSEER